MHTVRAQLDFSSRRELEWDFSKWLTQQAGAIFPQLFWPTVCFLNIYCLQGERFCCFTSNTSSHQEEKERQKQVGAGESWFDGGRRADVWMGKREKEGQKWRKTAVGEMC